MGLVNSSTYIFVNLQKSFSTRLRELNRCWHTTSAPYMWCKIGDLFINRQAIEVLQILENNVKFLPILYLNSYLAKMQSHLKPRAQLLLEQKQLKNKIKRFWIQNLMNFFMTIYFQISFAASKFLFPLLLKTNHQDGSLKES